jgi:hypothetical protein
VAVVLGAGVFSAGTVLRVLKVGELSVSVSEKLVLLMKLTLSCCGSEGLLLPVVFSSPGPKRRVSVGRSSFSYWSWLLGLVELGGPVMLPPEEAISKLKNMSCAGMSRAGSRPPLLFADTEVSDAKDTLDEMPDGGDLLIASVSCENGIAAPISASPHTRMEGGRPPSLTC